MRHLKPGKKCKKDRLAAVSASYSDHKWWLGAWRCLRNHNNETSPIYFYERRCGCAGEVPDLHFTSDLYCHDKSFRNGPMMCHKRQRHLTHLSPLSTTQLPLFEDCHRTRPSICTIDYSRLEFLLRLYTHDTTQPAKAIQPACCLYQGTPSEQRTIATRMSQ